MFLQGKLEKHLYEQRYFYLFAATMLQVFISSFFPQRTGIPIGAAVYTFFVLMTMNLVRHSRKLALLMLLFGIAGVFLVWIPEIVKTGFAFKVFEQAIIGVFISLIIYHILVQVIKSKKVDGTVVFGAITIYILFGLLAGDVNLLIQTLDPMAFSGNLELHDTAGLRYYSYVTITTLGYGDITPVSQLARAASVFFSLMAQIYLAVIIAFIVGKLVAHSSASKE